MTSFPHSLCPPVDRLQGVVEKMWTDLGTGALLPSILACESHLHTLTLPDSDAALPSDGIVRAGIRPQYRVAGIIFQEVPVHFKSKQFHFLIRASPY